MPGVSTWAFTVHRMVLTGDGMLKKKTMAPDRFIDCYVKGEDGRLKELYQAIVAVTKAERLWYSSTPIYRQHDGFCGSMDCCRLLSYRKGYGYTLIRVGDRGMWHCEITVPGKRTNDIVFVDGKFEEILEFFKDIIS